MKIISANGIYFNILNYDKMFFTAKNKTLSFFIYKGINSESIKIFNYELESEDKLKEIKNPIYDMFESFLSKPEIPYLNLNKALFDIFSIANLKSEGAEILSSGR